MLDEEQKFLLYFKRKIAAQEELSSKDLAEFTRKYEDLMDTAKISLKMLDHAVQRAQRHLEKSQH